MSGRSSPSRGVNGGILTLFILAALIGGFFLFAPYWSTHLWWMIRSWSFWVIPLIVIAGLCLAASISDGARRGGFVLLAIGGVIAWFGWLFVYNYVQDSVYAESVQVTQDPSPSFKERAPFSVSAAQVRSNLGEVSGDVQSTMYVAKDETFSTLVEQRGWTTGYQTLLEQQIGAAGRNVPSRCDFDQARAGARLGGVFSGNLGRVINSEQRGVSWATSDAYGWCDPQGTPFVVVPLQEQEGLLVVTHKPAGVALYNGKTGEISIRSNAEGIPGPTYPLSLAAEQRESTHALDGFWAWMWGSAGWELPDEADSINSSNQSEFVLAGTEGGEFYVTPEAGRGSATAISAHTVMDAELQGPELAPVVVHRLDPVWVSPTAITDRVRADFGDVLARNPGAELAELAPTSGTEWVATIGRPQNMLYRVKGEGTLSQPLCLYDLTGKQLRCGGAGGIGVATDAGGVASPGSGPAIAPAAADSDLTKLDVEQLGDLDRRVGEELVRRANKGTPVPAGGN